MVSPLRQLRSPFYPEPAGTRVKKGSIEKVRPDLAGLIKPGVICALHSSAGGSLRRVGQGGTALGPNYRFQPILTSNHVDSLLPRDFKQVGLFWILSDYNDSCLPWELLKGAFLRLLSVKLMYVQPNE